MSIDRSEIPTCPPPDADAVTVGPELDSAAWDRFVDGHADATLYHRWQWRGLLERALRQETVYLSARQDGRITGVLPLVCFRSALFGRFLVSLPVVNYGGVLAESPIAARALVARAAREAEQRGAAHVELRHASALGGLPARTHKVTMLLALPPSAEVLWRAFDNKVRNQVRKAEKSDLQVQIGGPELAGDFYAVFAANMRDLGVPIHSCRFYQDVLEQVEGARAFIVRHGTRPIAAGITLKHRGRVENPWASSLVSFRPMCPNMLLYWAMLKTAIADDATVFDFGRSTRDSSTYRFKKQWGALAEPLVWEYVLGRGASFPDHSTSNPKFAAAVAVWRRLPHPLVRLISPPIARSLP